MLGLLLQPVRWPSPTCKFFGPSQHVGQHEPLVARPTKGMTHSAHLENYCLGYIYSCPPFQNPNLTCPAPRRPPPTASHSSPIPISSHSFLAPRRRHVVVEVGSLKLLTTWRSTLPCPRFHPARPMLVDGSSLVPADLDLTSMNVDEYLTGHNSGP
jgi:hypothetical protein